MNSDEADARNPIGAAAVVAYLPLNVGGVDRRVVGVLEISLPYGPVARSFAASNRATVELIIVGLIGVWAALSAITWSVTRRLRRSAIANEYMAFHDLLTGLPNRALFADRFSHAIAAARRSGEELAIAIVGLDGFRAVNDALGHENGDTYLRCIGESLGDALRPGDTIARLGGDEFGLVLHGVTRPSARAVLERVQQVLAADVEIEGVPVSSEASIGVAFWPADGTEIDGLLRGAEVAMNAAKEVRCSIVEYTTDLAHFSPARLALVSELRHAIDAGQLVLHYQPQLGLRTDQVVGVEALLRWQHPTRGLLLPAEFLEIAESTGLIDPLTDWVVGRAIAQAAAWRDDGLVLRVGVNVSARNLRNDRLLRTVSEQLAAHRLAPECLEIEITETVLIADRVRATALLEQVRALGIRVSLDDFGQGYTSFAQLGRLPLTELKIDASFVSSMLVNHDDYTIVTSIIELGHKFGLEIVAEGEESVDILDVLDVLGCDIAQGWALAPALPADALARWVGRYHRESAAPTGSEVEPEHQRKASVASSTRSPSPANLSS